MVLLGEELLGELPVEFWPVAAPFGAGVVVGVVVLCVLPALDPVCEVPDDVAEEGLLV